MVGVKRRSVVVALRTLIRPADYCSFPDAHAILPYRRLAVPPGGLLSPSPALLSTHAAAVVAVAAAAAVVVVVVAVFILAAKPP